MPVKRQRSFLDRFLEQERTPVYTSLSMLTTVIVWVIITLDCLTNSHGWGVLVQIFLLLVVLAVGSPLNIVFGLLATSRGEYCGGRVSAIGIALWLLTLAVFSVTRVGLME